MFGSLDRIVSVFIHCVCDRVMTVCITGRQWMGLLSQKLISKIYLQKISELEYFDCLYQASATLLETFYKGITPCAGLYIQMFIFNKNCHKAFLIYNYS